MNQKISFNLVIIIIIFSVALLTGTFFYFYFKSTKESFVETNKKTANEEVINLVLYHNSQLGFSIKIPDKIPFDYIEYDDPACPDFEHPNFVPIKILEDNANGVIYIEPEYFYEDDRRWDQKTQSYNYIGECKKIITSLETIKDKKYYYSESGAIYIKNIKNDIELNRFIKERYYWPEISGEGCFAIKKDSWPQQNNVYKITIGGSIINKIEDYGRGNTTCDFASEYYLLYYPEKQKAMTINFGQENPFTNTANYQSENQHSYSEDMINSFRFD